MNNEQIPLFFDAVKNFKFLLKSLSYPSSICWVFRDDIYEKRRNETIVHIPIPENRVELIKKAYNNGRKKGMVRMPGLCSIGPQCQLFGIQKLKKTGFKDLNTA
jgi:hypothetical protein